jgi:phosphatidylserine/phosphatidylglycerophosphate/cardiolipin synthase-like enzyme
MLCVYHTQFVESLLALQQKYIEDSQEVNPDDWRSRPATERFSGNLARLCSPLLSSRKEKNNTDLKKRRKNEI